MRTSGASDKSNRHLLPWIRQIRARGRMREVVAPHADPVTRTFAMRITLIDPPGAMWLGSTVTGSVSFNSAPAIEIPSMVLFESSGKPAAWEFDSVKQQMVAARNVAIGRYDTNSVIIAQGVRDGNVAVTAGAQVLRPSQKVRLLDGVSC